MRNIATDGASVELRRDGRHKRSGGDGDRVRRGGGDRVRRGGGDRVRRGGGDRVRGAATTDDETVATAGNKTAANGGIMYADEGPYTIDVRHVEKMVGTTKEAADGDRVRRGLDGDEIETRTAVPGTRPATRRRRRLVTRRRRTVG